MFKIIDGIRYMQGTSEGSLIPATMWDEDTGLHIGFRLEIHKNVPPDNVLSKANVSSGSVVLQYGLFVRVQFYNKKGEDMAFQYNIAQSKIKNMLLRPSSAIHMSGELMKQNVLLPPDKAALKDIADKIKTSYIEVVTVLAKQHYLTRLPDDVLGTIADNLFKEKLGITEAAPPKDINKESKIIEDQIDSLSLKSDFDFMSMISKKGGSDST